MVRESESGERMSVNVGRGSRVKERVGQEIEKVRAKYKRERVGSEYSERKGVRERERGETEG